MNAETLALLQSAAGVLFASVLLIVTVFLIARVARVRQPMALILALAPMAVLLAVEAAILPAFGMH